MNSFLSRNKFCTICILHVTEIKLTSMSVPCTKELLLSLIEDIELIARELIENSVAPKQSRMPAHEHKAVTELLVSKDMELKETLKLAAEQGGVEKEIEMVRVENDFIIENYGRAYWPPPIWWPITVFWPPVTHMSGQ